MHTASTSAAALLVWCGFSFAPATAFAAPPNDSDAHFEKKVRPVLVEKCMSCHGPEKQQGGLRVDSRAVL